MPRAVVAGGSGFIGSHLCCALLERGYDVVAADNFVTGSRRNIEEALRYPGFTQLDLDITREFDLAETPDIIFHLASPASVPDYLSRPLETLSVNSFGTRNLLELARRHHAKFLYGSTSEVYGDPLVHPQTETYWGNVNPVGVRACYDEGKRFGEALTVEYGRTLGVDVRNVRIFNTYGPHSRPDDGRIVPNFITQALRREPITIYGDGSQTRSFCYVSDMVEGILRAVSLPDTNGEIFNLGNPDEYSVLDFAAIIARRLGSQAGFVYRPLPVDDPVKRCPDISKAKRVLGWAPRVELEDGIDRTAEWFREILGVAQPVS